MKANLRDIIRYLVYNATYPPTKTSLIKLVYMADYYHTKAYGVQLTDCEYQLRRYGAVCFAIPDTAREIPPEELKKTVILYPNGYGIIYEPGSECKRQFGLTSEQRQILDLVIAKHSGQSLPELKKAHYETEPMQKVRKNGEKLDMTVTKRSQKIGENARIKGLQSRISKMNIRTSGAPEECAEHYKTMMSTLALARKRANTVRIGGDK